MRKTCIFVASVAYIAAPAAAQEGHEVRAPASSVMFDQLPTISRPRAAESSAMPDFDIVQPSEVLPAAKVTSVEISTRAESRAVDTPPLAGRDGCDPVGGRASLEICRHKIETRVSDYARPRNAPVTPEGRLLMLINSGNGSASGDLSGRSLVAVGLNAPGGPAEQLAGALRDGTVSQDGAATNAGAVGGNSYPLFIGVPTIVVLPK